MTTLLDTSPVSDTMARLRALVSRHAGVDLRHSAHAPRADTRAARAGRPNWKLDERTHRSIHHLKRAGYKKTEIARELGIGTTTIHRVLHQ